MSAITDQHETPQPRRCWFCTAMLTGGRAGNTSREHVLALWLQDELGLYNLEITPTWHSQPLGDLLGQRRQTWGTPIAGRVCSDCNNRWMSDLETAAKPLLVPLIRAEESIASLGSSERLIISRWAAKTVYALSASVQEQRVPPEQYQLLRDSPAELPPGVFVVAAHTESLSARAHYTIDATWKVSRKFQDPADAVAVSRTSYKAYLQLGSLVLLVLWWPLGSEWVLSFEEKLYERLWPAEARVLYHPAPEPLPAIIQAAAGREAMYQLDHDSAVVPLRYTQSVNVFHRSDLPGWLLGSFGIDALTK